MEEKKTASKTIKSNIKDTALIFEGGGCGPAIPPVF